MSISPAIFYRPTTNSHDLMKRVGIFKSKEPAEPCIFVCSVSQHINESTIFAKKGEEKKK